MTTEAPTTNSSQPKPTVRFHGGTHYSVSSRTRAGYTHHINTLNLTCSCEAGRAGRRCWALAVALQFEAWRRNEEAKARAALRASAPVPPVPAPVPATPPVEVAGDWHDSAAYRGLAEAFGA